MKILIAHNKYKEAGGEDVVFSQEAELLRSNGHSVATLVFDNTKIATIVDKLICGLRVIYNPSAARIVEREIARFRPDILHVHNFVPLLSPAIFFVARRHRVPVVLTLHNYRLLCPGATLFHKGKVYEKSMRSVFPFQAIAKGVYRNSVWQTAAVALMTAVHSFLGTWKKKVDVYITLTDFARMKFLNSSIGIPADKFLVKPNFIQDIGATTSVKRDDYYLFVGRLTEEKGIRTLLNAARRSPFKLVIIGTGPLSDLVREHARENRAITFIGYQDKSIVRRYMATCKALLFPSVWYEGFPVTILEALCTGTVVIASDIGAMAEIITHGVNGLLFTAGDEKDCIRRIEELENDPAMSQSLSKEARLAYMEKYTPVNNYCMLMDIYHYAMASAHVLREAPLVQP